MEKFVCSQRLTPPRDLILSDNSNPYAYLVVDTSLFPAEFQSQLLTALSAQCSDSLDAHINGTLIHSDNFQALNLLQACYHEQVKCIYIDPPYNTGGDGFIYKDGYQRSSWGTLMHNRLVLAKPLLNQAGVIFQSIDDNEQANLKLISDDIFGKKNFNNNLIVKRSANGMGSKEGFSTNHDYVITHIKEKYKEKNVFFGITPSQEYRDKFSRKDEFGYYKIDGIFRKKGAGARKEDSPSCFYPIYFNPNTGAVSLELSEGLVEALPYLPNGNFGRWIWSKDFAKERVYRLYASEGGTIYVKDYWDNSLREKPRSIFERNSYLTDTATNEIVKFFGDKAFSTPKPFLLINDLIDSSSERNSLILDYFAGSGTTAHAVINLNREDGGNRQYILVEQGEYFDTVLKPRVQKVIYSQEWKDGKPVPSERNSDGLNGVPQIVKVLKLESYEDTLNNLELRRSGLFDRLPEEAQNDYLLHYMLNIESRDSLLNVSHFTKPFDYGLNISTTSAGAYDWQKVDLVETFNYLIGAKVIGVDDKRTEQGFVAVECRLPNQSADEKTLIFWRDCERMGYGELQKHFDRLGINPADSEYGQIYLNGDHTLETVWDGEQSGSLKILSIEDAFLSLMFEGDA